MQSQRGTTLLWTGLVVAIVLGLLWQFFPLPDAQSRIKSLPLAGPNFVGQDVALSDWEKGFFKNVNVLKRLYHVDNKVLFVTALDGTKNRHAVHDPLYCFRGSGFEVVSQKSEKLDNGGTVAFVKLKKDGKEQDAMYWFTNGKDTYDSPLKFWIQATIRRLSLGMSGQEPILIVVQPVDNTALDWKKIVHTFPQLLTL